MLQWMVPCPCTHKRAHTHASASVNMMILERNATHAPVCFTLPWSTDMFACLSGPLGEHERCSWMLPALNSSVYPPSGHIRVHIDGKPSNEASQTQVLLEALLRGRRPLLTSIPGIPSPESPQTHTRAPHLLPAPPDPNPPVEQERASDVIWLMAEETEAPRTKMAVT